MGQLRKSLRQHKTATSYSKYPKMKILKLFFKNLKLFIAFKNMRCDYILNPKTKELHKVGTARDFLGAHNLDKAKLQKFIGLKDIGDTSIDELPEGAKYYLYDFKTRKFIDKFTINKCGHCFNT